MFISFNFSLPLSIAHKGLYVFQLPLPFPSVTIQNSCQSTQNPNKFLLFATVNVNPFFREKNWSFQFKKVYFKTCFPCCPVDLHLWSSAIQSAQSENQRKFSTSSSPLPTISRLSPHIFFLSVLIFFHLNTYFIICIPSLLLPK